MPNLGTKYVCFSCQTKFYDLGREVALCPKCGANQKDADSSPAPVTKTRRVVEVVVDDDAEVDETPERDDADDEVEIVDDDAETPATHGDDETDEDFD
jgi:uncharacterized protein (TIGR02300 family)